MIDPMAGDGSMLAAAQRRANFLGSSVTTAAFEIDVRLGKPLAGFDHVWIEDAFSVYPEAIRDLGQFDAVIGNPPYIRYQDLGTVATARSAATRKRVGKIWARLSDREVASRSIRLSLIEGSLQGLRPEDREMVAVAALNGRPISVEDEHLRDWIWTVATYGGQADLSLPSWLLTWPLLKDRGRVAFVTSGSWRTRRYAAALRYFMTRFFRPILVLEQDGPTWFEDAQVHSTLIVLEKVSAQSLDPGDRGISRRPLAIQNVVRTHNLATNEGLRSFAALKGTEAADEAAAAEISIRLLTTGSGLSVPVTRTEYSFGQSDGDMAFLSRIQARDAIGGGRRHTTVRTSRLRAAANGLESLDEIGVSVHQGLRTGFNPFFYLHKVPTQGLETLVSSRLGGPTLRLDSALMTPVVHTQAQLVNLAVSREDLTIFALTVPRGDRLDGATGGHLRTLLPRAILNYVRWGETITVERDGRPRPITELTAVAPNVSKRQDGSATPWYAMPIAERHRAPLFAPRVISDRVKVYRNDGCLVDANFTTFLPRPGVDVDFVFALLNSSWVTGHAELIGTPMGGGALKLEASHWRVVGIPRFTASDIDRLAQLGVALRADADAQLLIDDVVFEAASRHLSGSIVEVKDGLHRSVAHRRQARLRR